MRDVFQAGLSELLGREVEISEPVLLDLADEAIARSVLALQREAYAVEAELVRDRKSVV